MKNSGFSLVELIIVIAIMAALLGTLAPQYIKYVDKSREASDEDNADSLLRAAHLLAADDDYIKDINDGDTITFDSNGVVGSSQGVTDGLAAYFSGDLSKIKPKSRLHRNERYVITFSKMPNGDFVLDTDWQ